MFLQLGDVVLPVVSVYLHGLHCPLSGRVDELSKATGVAVVTLAILSAWILFEDETGGVAVVRPLHRHEPRLGGVWKECGLVQLLQLGVGSSEPGEVVVVVSVVHGHRLVPLPTVRVAGEPSESLTSTPVSGVRGPGVRHLIHLVARDGHHLASKPGHQLWWEIDGTVPCPVDLTVQGLHLAIHVKMLHLPGHVGLEVGGVGAGGPRPVRGGARRVTDGIGDTSLVHVVTPHQHQSDSQQDSCDHLPG